MGKEILEIKLLDNDEIELIGVYDHSSNGNIINPLASIICLIAVRI